MVRKRSKQREDAAYHEAGHAVMCWSQKRAFRSVSIVGEGDSDGTTSCRPPGNWFQPEVRMDARTRRRVEQEIEVAWGGTLAQGIHDGLRPDTLAFPFGGDFESIVWFAGCVVGSEEIEQIEDYAERLRLRAYDTLRQPDIWRAVEALAKALLERGMLNWREARQVMKDAALRQSEPQSPH